MDEAEAFIAQWRRRQWLLVFVQLSVSIFSNQGITPRMASPQTSPRDAIPFGEGAFSRELLTGLELSLPKHFKEVVRDDISQFRPLDS